MSLKSKIPKHAKCVFEGILFDVYHWKQKMFDGSIRTFEAVRRLPSSQAICLTKEKKFIILYEEQPHVGKFTSIPGGHVDRGETPLENIEKELMEELGMSASKIDLFQEVNIGSKIDWPSYYYIARDCEVTGKPKIDSGGEKIKSIEVDFNKFIEMTQRNDFRNKFFQAQIFKMINTSGQIDKFKKLLLD